MSDRERCERLIHLFLTLAKDTRSEREFALELLLEEIDTIGYGVHGPEVWRRARRINDAAFLKTILHGDDAVAATEHFEIQLERLKFTRTNFAYVELSPVEAKAWAHERNRRRTEKATEANAKRHEEKYGALRVVVGGDR